MLFWERLANTLALTCVLVLPTYPQLSCPLPPLASSPPTRHLPRHSRCLQFLQRTDAPNSPSFSRLKLAEFRPRARRLRSCCHPNI